MIEVITDTETLIKQAAKKVFLRKGLAGTRLQEIADEAGISRTSLHYYFRSKEKLFEIVWREVFCDNNNAIKFCASSNFTIIEKLQGFVLHYFEKAMIEPAIDIFILNEFNNNPEIMKDIMLSGKIENPASFLLADITQAVEDGELVGEPTQILITLISMCFFSFAGKSMLQSMLAISEDNYMKLMHERKMYLMKFVETAFKL